MRAAIPDVAFGTDIIVGFPGETDDDFEQTLEVVEQVGFDSAFTFVYSPRQGTEAASMPDQVPHETKIERMERLVELTQRHRARAQRARVGRVEEVLVEGPVAHRRALLRGRTRRNTTVNFAGDARAGELVARPDRAATSTTLRGRRGARRRPGLAGLGPMRDPRHRLVRPDRHEPRPPPAGRRPLGLRRRQAANAWTSEFETLLQDLAIHYPAFKGGIAGVEYPEVDLVVHLAAHAKVHQLVRQPHRALENAIMTFNVLEYCAPARAAARLLVDARGVRRRSPLRRVRGGDAPTSPTPRARTRRRRSLSEAFIYSYARATACATSSSASRTSTAATTTTFSAWSACCRCSCTR